MALEIGTLLLLMRGDAGSETIDWSLSNCRVVAKAWLGEEGVRRNRVAFLEPVDTEVACPGLVELPSLVTPGIDLRQEDGRIVAPVTREESLRFDEGTRPGDAYVCAGRMATAIARPAKVSG